jgi:uncharacterized membrane protein YeaQ/YmgE (transglycosylase-associated protein family)
LVGSKFIGNLLILRIEGMIAAVHPAHVGTGHGNMPCIQKLKYPARVLEDTLGHRRATMKEARMLGALIFWIIVGLIAGALAKFIMPGDDPGGFIITILLGVAGAIVGGFLASLIGIGGGGTIWTIIIATIGAIILLAIYRAVAGGRAAR